MSAVLYHHGMFPPTTIDLHRLFALGGRANAAIARYAGLLAGLPNSDVLLSPLTVQEAVLSSRIEGTQATMGEVLQLEADDSVFEDNTPKKADIREVLNYRAALMAGVKLLETLPLSERLVREVHRVLMQGVRGRSKDPGEYRRILNWIGPDGCSIDQARFIPVTADRLPEAMRAWERYLNAEDTDVLVQLAVCHAEFEAIHPFLDGNGRVGRLLVPLFLFSRGVLTGPSFYLSEYLEKHRQTYYDRLLAISRDGNWTDWVEFFLTAITEQASINQGRVQAILELYERRKVWIVQALRSQHAIRALDWLFRRPIFKTSDFRDSVGIPSPTASRIIRLCRDNGMLRELRRGSGRTAAILCFPELLNLAEGRDVF